MRLQKKRPFRTFILTRGLLGGIISGITGMGVFILLCAAALFFSAKGGSFGEAVINRYFGNNKVYAEVAEIITDPKGRVSAIMGGYTKLISESVQNTPQPQEQTETPQPNTPEPVKVVESTAKSLLEIKNLSGKTVDADALVAKPLAYKIEDSGPQVLIVHTHTTESYFEQDRSVDENLNMTAVGNVIEKKLTDGGIQTIHDTTVHDYPSYNGAYTRAAATTRSRLSENPGIKIVLDVHRDAVAAEDGSKLKLSCDINGEKTAQVMFVVGTDAQLEHKNWQENLCLALKLQREAKSMYPDLMRPINLREQRFNQQLSMGSIIIEIGTNGNTLEEAKRGAACIGDVLVKVLSENK